MRTECVRSSTAVLLLLAILATTACNDSAAPTPPDTEQTVSLKVEPDRASLVSGRKISLSAQLFDKSGAPLIVENVSWVSLDPSVATVSPAGEVSANGVGSTTVVATAGGGKDTATITVLPIGEKPGPSPGEHGGYFVSPSGSSGASGSASSPWSLATALSGGNGRVQPGDTIWLRGGTYKGDFNTAISGTASAPIIVRQYPGERATINGSLATTGKYTWFWGFEVANADAGSQGTAGVNSLCTGCRFINLVIHDHSSNGLGMWSEGPDQEAYGNIIYNNGFYGQSADHAAHGIYAQNSAGAKRLIDNILVNQFGYGVHIYAEESGMWNFIVSGNTAINNGQDTGMDYQVGGLQPVENLIFTNNMSYRNPSRRDDETARLGYNWGPTNYAAMVIGNYLVGKLLEFNWSGMTFEDNTILDSSMPTTTRVVVQPNLYEAGRANVIVYNWGHQGAVSVDLSKVLHTGDEYEVRNAQDFYGSPVSSGTYSGGSVSVPITSITTARSITGRSTSSTGSEFNVYVVMRK